MQQNHRAARAGICLASAYALLMVTAGCTDPGHNPPTGTVVMGAEAMDARLWNRKGRKQPGGSVEPAPAPAPTPAPAPAPTPAPSGTLQTILQLGWQPNTDPIAGYIVYFGPAAANTPNVASDLPIASTAFNAQAPTVSYNAATQLGLQTGDSVCFRLRAYNADGALSNWSPAACGTI